MQDAARWASLPGVWQRCTVPVQAHCPTWLCTLQSTDLLHSNSYFYSPFLLFPQTWAEGDAQNTPLGKLGSVTTYFSLCAYLNKLGAERLHVTFYQYCLH